MGQIKAVFDNQILDMELLTVKHLELAIKILNIWKEEKEGETS